MVVLPILEYHRPFGTPLPQDLDLIVDGHCEPTILQSVLVARRQRRT